MTRFTPCSIFSTIAVLMSVNCVDAEDSNLIQQIEKAWKDREDRFPIYEVKLEEKILHPKGGLSESFWQAGLLRKKMDGSLDVVPPQDAEFNCETLLRVAKNQIRLDTTDILWVREKSDFKKTSVSLVCFNDRLKTFYPVGFGGTVDKPEGVIHEEGASLLPFTQLGSFTPISIFFRGVNPRFSTINDLSGYEIVDPNDNRNGIITYHLKTKANTGSLTHLWITHNDYRLIGEESYEKEHKNYQLDIQYTNQSGQLLPSSLKYSFFTTTGDLRASTHAVVKQVSFPSTIDDEVFTLSYPPGTVVRDENNKLWTIVRQDSSSRTLSSAELTIPYEALKSKVDAETPARRYWRWYAAIGVLVVVLVGIGWRYRKSLQVPRSL